MRVIYGLGRFIFGGFFLYSGINHLTNTEALAGYAAAKNQADPRTKVQASGALLVASGASMAFGLKPGLGALGVIGFLAAATPQFHDFWTEEDPGQEQNQIIHFSKNLALIGAAIAVLGAECKCK